VDLEANSLYVYRESVCLLQLTVEGKDFIVDPLAGVDLSGFGELLADERVEKVFHASEYDLMLLKRDYGWELSNLFDTMWAARILGHKNMGLAGFLREFYDVAVSKKHQKANWGLRPLSSDMLHYAQTDTHYLLRLRDELAASLEEVDRMTEAREIFAGLCNVKLPDQEFTPDGFWTVRGARALEPRQQAVLKALYVFRDEEARRRDLPAFKVFNNDALIGMATALPDTKERLADVRGIGVRNHERYCARLLEVITAARAADRFERLSQWRRDRALARGVESDVILSRETMWDIARGNPNSLDELARIPGIGPCRLQLHGESILGELT